MKAQFVFVVVLLFGSFIITNIFIDDVFKRVQKESIGASLTVISQTANVTVEPATPSLRSKNTNQTTETLYFNAFKIFIGKCKEK
jgi:hypothetical protein